MSNGTTWVVEKSHKVKAPHTLVSSCLEDLRSQLQDLADSYWPSPNNPPLGQLEFRYELDDEDRVNKVHAFYKNKRGLKSRFMRLKRLP